MIETVNEKSKKHIHLKDVIPECQGTEESWTFLAGNKSMTFYLCPPKHKLLTNGEWCPTLFNLSNKIVAVASNAIFHELPL